MKYLTQSVVATCYLFLHSCNGLTSIDLHFTSNNCDEEARTITESKSYNLTWNGQIRPKLCTFSFKGGYLYTSGAYQLCFQSVFYNIPYSMGDVHIKIKNYTRSSWEYDRSDNKIPKTCVNTGYKLNVSILVPTGYREPVPKTYIQLNITASVISEDSDLSVASTILGVLAAVIITIIVCGSLCRQQDNPIGQCIRCILDCLSTFKRRVTGGNTQNESPSVRTEFEEIAEISQQAPVSSSESIIMEHPPSYSSLTDMDINKDPTVPPPSYEEVTGRKEPSAPYYQ